MSGQLTSPRTIEEENIRQHLLLDIVYMWITKEGTAKHKK
jgi:hypothetical protein